MLDLALFDCTDSSALFVALLVQSHTCYVAAGFAIFAIVVMPMLKVDPNEYKELMGDKKAREALPATSSEGTSTQSRLR